MPWNACAFRLPESVPVFSTLAMRTFRFLPYISVWLVYLGGRGVLPLSISKSSKSSSSSSSSLLLLMAALPDDLLPDAPLAPPMLSLPKSVIAASEMPLAVAKLCTLPCTPPKPPCSLASPSAMPLFTMPSVSEYSTLLGLVCGVQPKASIAFAMSLASMVEPFSLLLVVRVASTFTLPWIKPLFSAPVCAILLSLSFGLPYQIIRTGLPARLKSVSDEPTAGFLLMEPSRFFAAVMSVIFSTRSPASTVAMALEPCW